MIVRELITKLGFNVDDAGMRKAEAGIGRIKKQADFAAQAMMGVGASLAGAAWAKSAIAIADEMQNIRSRIGMLPQTIGDVGEAFDEVGRRASATGMAIEAYAGLYTRVGNAAKDYISTQEDLLGITDTIAKSLVVGGASAQEASSVMLQFSQALGSGVLQGAEFNAMAEASSIYMDQLALAIGKPREKLKKMASDGQLTAREVIEATRKMSAYFDDKFRKMPMTVSRATTAVSNSYSMMIDRMNRESMFISELAGLIVSALDKIERGVNKLADALGGWDQMLKLIGIGLTSVFGATAILLIKVFGAAVLAVALPFIILAAKIALVILILEDLWVWFKRGDSVIGDLIGPWQEWAPYVMAVINMVRDAVVWYGEAIGAVAAMIVGMLTLDGNLFMASLEGLTEMLWSVIQQWWAYLVESFKAAWNAVSQFFVGAMAALGEMIYKAIFAPIFNAVRDAWNSVKGIASGELLAQWGAAIRAAFVNAFTKVTAYVTATFASWGAMIYKAIFAPIVSAVTNAFNSVKGIASGAWKGIKGFVGLGGGAGTATGFAPTVGPARLAPAATWAARPNVQSNTNVTVTVPPGTTAEQAKFLQGAARQSFSKGANDKFARDAAIYAR